MPARKSATSFHHRQFPRPSLVALCGSLLLCLFLAACGEGDRGQTSPPPAATQGKQPYQFGETARIIDFGTQPLAVPTGTLAEIMRRDQTLANDLARLGYELRLHSFCSGEEINKHLRQEQLEAAVAGDMPTLIILSEKVAKAVALMKQDFSSIIARRNMLPAELAGKTVGYVPGSTAHYVLLNLLHAAGMKTTDLTLTSMPVKDMPAALAKNKIDAFAAWEPTPAIALKDIEDARAIHRSLSTSFFLFHNRFAEEHPDAARAMLAALARAMRWMDKNLDNLLAASSWTQEGAAVFSGQPPRLTVEENAALIREGILDIASSPIIPETLLADNGLLASEFLFLQRHGSIPATASWPSTKQGFDNFMLLSIITKPDLYRLDADDFAP